MVKNVVMKNRFYDSVFLMQIATKVKEHYGIDRVSVLMGTEANKAVIRESGLLEEEARAATPSDLIIAVKTENEEQAEQSIKKVQEMLEVQEVKRSGDSSQQNPRTVEGAARVLSGSNVVLISLPGPYVAFEAKKALSAGLNLMIFSDNVPLEDEIELKRMARDRGLLVMGPDCGTAILKGKALGFANVVKSGPVGIVGASGTGIQQATVLLTRHGVGITHAIGTGSRDLSKEVGGIAMRAGLRALAEEKETEVILLISKPPHPEVAAMIIEEAKKAGKPVVINFLNGNLQDVEGDNIECAVTLEDAVGKTLALVKKEAFAARFFDEKLTLVLERAYEKWKSLTGTVRYIRGLYSGGTLCEEALIILNGLLGKVYSNTKVFPEAVLSDARKSVEHSLVDLGDDEFTRGTPHPMIDYTLRKERMLEEALDPDVAVMLLDVVLGYGSHADPASELIPVIEKIQQKRESRPILFVASLIGTDEDPQNLEKQKRELEKAGVMILPSNAQAARFAALLASMCNVADRFKEAEVLAGDTI